MTLVSENIRYLRKLNGLTQEQFARKINIKRSLLGAYEEARANPNQQNMMAIARAFNTTIELLTRQDLRKLRETPNLSIPLGHGSAPARVDGSAIRSDGKLEADNDDPFQHPDFPDIFAAPDPEPTTPAPQPLAQVLNKFYQPPSPREARPAPVPPIITPPVRPTAERVVPEGQSATAFQPIHLDGPGRSPVDRLFGPSDPAPVAPAAAPVPRPAPAPTPTFNRSYPEPGAPAVVPGQSASGPAIPVIRQAQLTEYAQRYQQTDFIQQQPAMQLPHLPAGQYRAFEAGDDFAFPGALLVGQFVRNWFDIADGKFYVLLIGQQGICSRRVYNQVKVKGSLLLSADRADMPNQEVLLKDVLEVWEVCAFVSQQLPQPVPNTDRLRQLVDELRFEVGRF